MDDYDIAVRKWAAEKINGHVQFDRQFRINDKPLVFWTDIERVSVELESGGGDPYDSLWKAPSIRVEAKLKGIRSGTRYLGGEELVSNFHLLLQEILAVEVTEEDRGA